MTKRVRPNRTRKKGLVWLFVLRLNGCVEKRLIDRVQLQCCLLLLVLLEEVNLTLSTRQEKKEEARQQEKNFKDSLLCGRAAGLFTVTHKSAPLGTPLANLKPAVYRIALSVADCTVAGQRQPQ